ncbi:MAG TPA: phage protein [Lelliottia sp.]|jgi:hypothetical protein
MLFDIKQISLVLSGRTITGFTTDNDALDVSFNNDAGKWTIGAQGKGVWVANPDASGKLTIKLLQQHADNAWLANQMALQRSDPKSFTAYGMNIRDLLNNDLVTGSKGYHSTPAKYTRGGQHNPGTWIIEFESVQQVLGLPFEN